MTAQKKNAMRKVAILVDSLDRNTADALLDTLSAEQSEQVRDVLIDLEPIHAEERKRVLDDFFNAGFRPAPVDSANAPSSEQTPAGKPQAKSEETTPADPTETEAVALELSSAGVEALERAPQSPARTPRFTLAQAPAATLAAFLKKEQMQVAALVLAHLPRAKAAEVLQSFLPHKQAELARRIIDLRETDPSVIQAVEEEFAAIIAESMEEQLRRVSGQSVLQEILSSTHGAARESLVENLMQEGVSLAQDPYAFSPEEGVAGTAFTPLPTGPTAETSIAFLPASEIKGETSAAVWETHQPQQSPSGAGLSRNPVKLETPPAEMPEFAFNDLAKLDQESLYRVLGESPALSMLALAGASTHLVTQISRGLTSREANLMRRRMEQLGPIRLRDVEQAQFEIAQIAAQLAQQGEITLPVKRRFAVAA